MEWLCPANIDPSQDQKRHSATMARDTVEWVLQDPIYQKWFSENGSFLWLHGARKLTHKLNGANVA